MQVVRLAHETDFEGWRIAARGLRARRIAPEAAIWTVDGTAEKSGPEALPQGFTVPREFLVLAEQVILHRSDERFALLYRLLWRLAGEPRLLRVAADPDVGKAREQAMAVARAMHRMKAFA